MPVNLEEIREGCLRQDPAAQKLLYETYKAGFMGICRRYTASREQAQDVLQESFVKIFTKISTYSNTGSFEGWMTRIVINTALKLNQKWDQRKVNKDVLEFDIPDTAVSVLDTLSQQELLEMVAALPTGYRNVFNLYAIDGYTHVEVGKMLGINPGTSKSQLSRAKALLAQKLQQIKAREKKMLNENASAG